MYPIMPVFITEKKKTKFYSDHNSVQTLFYPPPATLCSSLTFLMLSDPALPNFGPALPRFTYPSSIISLHHIYPTLMQPYVEFCSGLVLQVQFRPLFGPDQNTLQFEPRHRMTPGADFHSGFLKLVPWIQCLK